jgi:hypothetical protein
MSYGSDINVYVEDKAGDFGVSPSPVPWWISPDVDIPAHSGEAFQGSNTVQIRVHAHEEPFLEEKIVAEVYVGDPSLVMAPGSPNTVRIDPQNILFRPPTVAGTEPIADETGGLATFPWTPSSTAGAAEGPGHRCLIVRAFPQSVTPPTAPFDVPNEQHEAQHNIEVLSTTKMIAPALGAGRGIPRDPRRMDEDGTWSEVLVTQAIGSRRGTRYLVCAFDPDFDHLVSSVVQKPLDRAKVERISDQPPNSVEFDALDAFLGQIDPSKRRGFMRAADGGTGLLARERVLATASVGLGPRKQSHIVVRFDHSNLEPNTAAMLHVAQFREDGRPEGGMTIVAVAPRER